jgi:hypothetical protein
MSDRDQSRAVRKIVLPSGRTVEVIAHNRPDPGQRPLHVCPQCECELVHPVRWLESPQGGWELTLQCPNCGWQETGSFAPKQVEALETVLDDGLAEMLADLRRLSQANMAGDVERFSAALHADVILPEDF